MPPAALLTLATASVLLACAQNRNAYNDLPLAPTVRADNFHANIQDITELSNGVVVVCQDDQVVIFSDSSEEIDSWSFPFPAHVNHVVVFGNGTQAYVSLTSDNLWQIKFADNFTVQDAVRLNTRLPYSNLLAASNDGEMLFMFSVDSGQGLVEAKTGRKLWRGPNAENPNVAIIDEESESVFYGTVDILSYGDDNYVACLDLSRGQEIWRTPSKNDVIGLFELDDNHIVAIEKDTARVLKKSDGAVVTSVSTKTPDFSGVLRGSGACYC